MESLQDLLNQLMVSKAKELAANWEFPLAEILEQYNQRLMERETNLNYSKTALIIQNATNVLERRIDRLHSDTSGLRNSLNEHDAENETAKASKSRQKFHQNSFDLANIEHPDFQKEISKSCFLKHKKNKKKTKLLSQRYPQLENMCRHKFSLDVIDTNGEKIGKKYDFRCNQQLTSSHMLVDELSLEDFRNEHSADPAPVQLADLHLNSPPGCSTSSPMLSPINAEAQETSDLEVDEFCDTQEPGQSQESGYCTLTDISSTGEGDSAQNISKNLAESTDAQLLKKDSDGPADPSLDSLRIETPPEDLLTDSQNSPRILNESAWENSNAEKKRCRESVDTDAGYTSGGADLFPVESLRRSKRQRTSTSKDEANHRIFQPIPFDATIPEKIPKGRSEFKLPCHISLLRNSRTRKRKTNSDRVRRKKLAKFLMSDAENRSKLLMYSPGRPLIGSPKEEERQCIFEEAFKNRNLRVCRFDAVLNNHEELRGFVPAMSPGILTPNNCPEINLERVTSNVEKEMENSAKIIDDRLQELQEASCSYTPPHSPDFPADFQTEEDGDDDDDDVYHCEPSTSNLTHQQRIEMKMRELQREFNVRNEREEEIGSWLKTMDTLKAVERRPEFNVGNYESRIIDRLKGKPERKMDFENVVGREEPEDFARLFVASLHLANTRNVDIKMNEGESNFSLTLLNERRSQIS